MARLEDDPDQTAQLPACLGALAELGAGGAAPVAALAPGQDRAAPWRRAGGIAGVAAGPHQPTQKRGDGRQYPRYREALAVQTLAPLLAHGNPAVRGRVVEVLGDVEAKEAEALLAKLLDDRDEGIRAQACGQLAQRVTTGVAGASLEPLTKALTSGRRELLLAAAEGLAEQRRPEAFQPLLLAFSAGTEVERKRAIAALGKLADRRALEYLEPLVDANAELAADDRALAPDAAEALGAMLPKLDDADARQRLRATLERLAIEARGETRWRALSGLRRAADERSRGLLERIVADPYEAAEASMRAAAELGELGNAASEPVLEALLHQGRAELRQSGLAGLRKLYPTDATRVNLLALRSAYAEISQPAARYLARQADPATLAERLGEIDDAQARRRLRRGLIRRQTPPLEALRGLLQGEAPAPRAEAAWIAGGCGAQEWAAALQAAAARAARGWRQAHDEHLGVRAEAEANAWWASLWAARQLKLDIGQEARVALADSRPPNPVRRAAIHCLAQCGNRSDSRLLAPLLTDADPGIRSAAADALASLDGAQAGSQMAELEGADGAALRPMLRAALPNSAPLLATPEIRQISLPVYLEERHSAGLMKSAGAAGKAPARLSAIAALGRIGDEQAKTTLADILANRSEDGEVRAAAFKALRRLERNAARVNAYTPP
ncbi:MAG: HEAT repeat domain-containing protein [Gammaproteobacteria bacterium]